MMSNPIIIVALSLLLILFAVFLVFMWDRIATVKEKLSDVTHRKNEIERFLMLFSQSLQDNENIGETMNNTARYVADSIGAKAVCIYERQNEYLVPSGIAGNYPLIHVNDPTRIHDRSYLLERLRREKITIGDGFIGKVGSLLIPDLIDDALADVRFADYNSNGVEPIHSIMAVPLIKDDMLSGVVCAVNNVHNGVFSDQQFDNLCSISTQIVLTQNLVNVYSEKSRQQRISQELDFARQLQSSLLPASVPAWDQFAVHAFTRSAKEVNGDFYDFIEVDDNRLLIVMGDACGKGVPACLLSSMTRSFIRSSIGHFSDLEQFMRELNANLYRDSDAERFETLGCCLLDKKNSLVEYARLGHTDLLTFVRGHIRRISPDGAALGILPNELAALDTICLEFSAGMSMLMFSDGIIEALNSDGEEFGTERLQEIFKNACLDGVGPEEILQRILDDVGEFSEEQIDDQTMILIQHI